MEFKAKDRRLEGETLLRQCQLAELYILDVFVEICEKYNLRYFLDAGTLLGAARHGGFIPWDDDIDVGMPREDYDRFLKIAAKVLPDNLLVTPSKEYEGVGSFAKIYDRSSFFCERDSCAQEPCGIFIDIFPYEEIPHLPARIGRPLARLCNSAFINVRVHRRLHHRTITGIFVSWLKAVVWNSIYLATHLAFSVLKLFRHRVWRYTPGTSFWTYHDGFEYDDLFPLGTVEFEGKSYSSPHDVNVQLAHFYGDWRTPPSLEKRVWHHASVISLERAPESPWARPYKGT